MDNKRLIRKEAEYRQLLKANPKIQKLNEMRKQGIQYKDVDKVKSDLGITEYEARMYDRQKRKADRLKKLGIKTDEESDKSMPDSEPKEIKDLTPVAGQMDWTDKSKIPTKYESTEKGVDENGFPLPNTDKSAAKSKGSSSDAFKMAAKDKSRIKTDSKGNKYVEDDKGNKYKYIFKDSKPNTTTPSTKPVTVKPMTVKSAVETPKSENIVAAKSKVAPSNPIVYKGMTDLVGHSIMGKKKGEMKNEKGEVLKFNPVQKKQNQPYSVTDVAKNTTTKYSIPTTKRDILGGRVVNKDGYKVTESKFKQSGRTK